MYVYCPQPLKRGFITFACLHCACWWPGTIRCQVICRHNDVSRNASTVTLNILPLQGNIMNINEASLHRNRQLSWCQFVVTGGTGSCRYNNFLCHQWRRSCHHDDSQFSVNDKTNHNITFEHGLWCTMMRFCNAKGNPKKLLFDHTWVM